MKKRTLVSVLAVYLIIASNSNANVAEPEKHFALPRLVPPNTAFSDKDFSQDHNQAIILAGDPAKQGLKLGKKIVGDTVKKVKKVGKAVGQTVKGIGRKKNKEEDEPAKGSGSGHNPNNRMYEGQEDSGSRSDSYTKGGGGYQTMQQ